MAIYEVFSISAARPWEARTSPWARVGAGDLPRASRRRGDPRARCVLEDSR